MNLFKQLKKERAVCTIILHYHDFRVTSPVCSSPILICCLALAQTSNLILTCAPLISISLSVSRWPQKDRLKLTSHRAAATRMHVPRAVVIQSDRRRDAERKRENQGEEGQRQREKRGNGYTNNGT